MTQPTEGEFKCFTAVCTHQGCIVSSVQAGGIRCECHGSAFSIEDGSAVNPPATEPLDEVRDHRRGRRDLDRLTSDETRGGERLDQRPRVGVLVRRLEDDGVGAGLVQGGRPARVPAGARVAAGCVGSTSVYTVTARPAVRPAASRPSSTSARPRRTASGPVTESSRTPSATSPASRIVLSPRAPTSSGGRVAGGQSRATPSRWT